MTRKSKYATRTDGAVKSALLELLKKKPLADVTVSELAREAKVSRSTFYDHYGNPADVYDALIRDFSEDVSPLMSQVACSDALRPTGRSFCALVRDAGPLAPAVGEERFMDTFLSRQGEMEQHDLFALLVEAGYSQLQAQAICSFQMSGCFAAARSTAASSPPVAAWAR